MSLGFQLAVLSLEFVELDLQRRHGLLHLRHLDFAGGGNFALRLDGVLEHGQLNVGKIE